MGFTAHAAPEHVPLCITRQLGHGLEQAFEPLALVDGAVVAFHGRRKVLATSRGHAHRITQQLFGTRVASQRRVEVGVLDEIVARRRQHLHALVTRPRIGPEPHSHARKRDHDGGRHRDPDAAPVARSEREAAHPQTGSLGADRAAGEESA